MASRKILKVMQLARRGDTEAQIDLARCYLDGAEGLGRNQVAAYRWLAAAANHGDMKAAWLIGERITATAVDHPAKARPYFEKAKEMGSVRAITILAQWHLEGHFGPLDMASAKTFRENLLKAARCGDPMAQISIVSMSKDLISDGEHIAWLERAASEGEATAALQLSELYWQRCDGELWAAGQIPGNCLRRRNSGQIKDAYTALFWHKTYWDKQASMPAGEMLRRASLLLLSGSGEAGNWLEKAAAAGSGIAAYLRGVIFLGAGYLDALIGCDANTGAPAPLLFPRSYKQAELWLCRAAEMNVAEAAFGVWMVNNIRNYSLRNPAKACQYLQSAASLGHEEACWLVAESELLKGNLRAAIRWLERAAQNGLNKAERKLDELTSRVEQPDNRLLTLSHALKDEDAGLSARLELAAYFALAEAEYLLIDPSCADLGDLVCIDIRRHYRRSKVRLIRITTDWQRAALDRAKHLLPPAPAMKDVDYQNIRRRAQRRIAQLGNQASHPAYLV